MSTICYEEDGICEVYIYVDPYLRSKNKWMIRPIDKTQPKESILEVGLRSKEAYHLETSLQVLQDLKRLESEGYLIPFKVKAQILEMVNNEEEKKRG